MSITLSASSSLDELSKKIMKDLKQELYDYKIGVFDKQWIVTQTEGINFWMKNQIAEHTGVAANLQFAKMNDIVQLIYHWICPNVAHLMDKDRMTWALFAELDEQSFKDAYPNIAGYYVNSQMRRVSLAVEMADLFDQYQIYRHDEIENWNKDKVAYDADLTWQQDLWKKMKNLGCMLT
jgi:exodeoxyribonuclease V gamma subunit